MFAAVRSLSWPWMPERRIPSAWIWQETERVPDVTTYVHKLKEAAEAKIHAFIQMLGADARLR